MPDCRRRCEPHSIVETGILPDPDQEWEFVATQPYEDYVHITRGVHFRTQYAV